MYRRLAAIAALALALTAISAASTPQADASTTASKIRTLQKQVKQLRAQMRAVAGIFNCLQTVELAQYGDSAGTFGYLFDNAPGFPFDVNNPGTYTTGIDVATDATGGSTSVLIVNPGCQGRAARSRSLGPLFPEGHVYKATTR